MHPSPWTAPLYRQMPATNNNDAAHCLVSVIRQSESVLSWKALGASLDLCSSMFAVATATLHRTALERTNSSARFLRDGLTKCFMT